MTLADQASQLEALSNEGDKIDEDLSLEAGAPSLLNAMPELGDTVALLRGNDLREMISLNGPVKAALDDWLTWNRPMLMSSYEYYQYLRDKIAPIYEEAGLPEALLFAMIATETGGRVHSFSHAGAAGLLQFIRSTGQRYGLREVDGFDMRLDPEAATRANVAYINEQFEILNESFEMTLAAYNSGEYRMKRLQRRYKTGFWDQRVYYRVPRETREYVPRILAATWLFLHPEDYNLEFPVYQNELTELILKEQRPSASSRSAWGKSKARTAGSARYAILILASAPANGQRPAPPLPFRNYSCPTTRSDVLGEIWSKRLSSFTKPTTRTARWKSISFAEATHCGALPPGIDVSPPRSWPRSTTSAPPLPY